VAWYAWIAAPSLNAASISVWSCSGGSILAINGITDSVSRLAGYDIMSSTNDGVSAWFGRVTLTTSSVAATMIQTNLTKRNSRALNRARRDANWRLVTLISTDQPPA